MTLQWEQVLVDAADPAALGRWWAQALGWVAVDESPDEYEIRPAPDRLPGLLFGRSPDAKNGKNRLHLDFRPADQEAEVTRLLASGPGTRTSGRPVTSPGSCSRTRRETSSACWPRAGPDGALAPLTVAARKPRAAARSNIRWAHWSRGGGV